MSKIANKFGGGAQTNANGLKFEQTTSLDEALVSEGYSVKDHKIYLGSKLIGLSVPKHNLYSKFLEKKGIDYKKFNSKKWLPDECLINFNNKTAYIIEKKFQNTSGSVDEKLPGCDFKRKEYLKLFNVLDYDVEYLYIFNDWFLDSQYIDTLKYIESTGCHYFFNKIPLDFLNLI